MFNKKGVYFGLVFLAVILASSIVFGQEDPDLAPFDATVLVTNEPPSIIFVSNPGIVDPVEGQAFAVGVSFVAEDSNGALDLDPASGVIGFAGPSPNFYELGGSCIQDIANCDGCTSNQRNYSCGVSMQHYHDPGLWNILINVSDVGGLNASNNTQNLIYNLLKAISHEGGISWSSIGLGVDDVNQTANGAPPMTLFNRGNANLQLNITGHNLTGQSNPAQRIPSERFTVSPNTSPQPDPQQCNDPETATRLNVDNGQTPIEGIPITGALVPYGPPGSDEEELYYCIPETLNDLGLSDPEGYSTEIPDQWVLII